MLDNSRVFIIAEVGSVHDGSFGNACRLIDAVADCGADAVKFQTHIAAEETLRDAPCPRYFQSEPRYEYFERTAFTAEQWARLKAAAEKRGLVFLSAAFSEAAVDLLETMGVAGYKIPSGEVTNTPLLEKVAATGKPVLLSSGMNSWQEIESALAALGEAQRRVTLMQCTSEYPCPLEKVGLNVMQEMATRFGVPVGLSDHTLTPYAAFAAVALGARVIEKHFTFSRRMYGSDAPHSMEPAEFAAMVAGIRAIETMLANPVNKDDVTQFSNMKTTFEKSIVAAVDIQIGQVLTRKMLAFKKPGTGLPASRFRELLGRTVAHSIPRNVFIREGDLHQAPHTEDPCRAK
jgi:N-acetylneuraminate synthase